MSWLPHSESDQGGDCSAPLKTSWTRSASSRRFQESRFFRCIARRQGHRHPESRFGPLTARPRSREAPDFDVRLRFGIREAVTLSSSATSRESTPPQASGERFGVLALRLEENVPASRVAIEAAGVRSPEISAALDRAEALGSELLHVAVARARCVKATR